MLITSNVTTITLDGAETTVEFEKGYPYYWITNRGNADMSVSIFPGITPKAEGIYMISAGSTERIGTGHELRRFYMLGSGEAYIRGETIAAQPSFKKAGKGGDITCTQHITDGLQTKLSPGETTCNITWTPMLVYPLPITIELCGYYTNTPVSSGRWLTTSGNYSSNNLCLNQYKNGLGVRSHDSWTTGDQYINIDVNEKITLSVVYDQRSLKVYKNGVLVILRDNLNPSYVYDKIWIQYLFCLGEYNSYILDGNLKAVRIYDRELTEDEILQNVTADKQLYFKEV